MPIKILMPALSPTMTEGNLVRWLKSEGDKVSAGDVMCEIETDKATMEVEAVDEGTIGKILVPAGSEAVKVNQIIAVLLEEGEDKSAIDSMNLQTVEAAQTTEQNIESKAEEARPIVPTVAASPAAVNSGSRIVASPLARRIAEQKGINLSLIQGTGPHGRIIKHDVESARGGGKAATFTAVARDGGFPPFEKISVSSMRKVIAQRLTESKQTVPHFYLTVECNVDKLLDLRAQINSSMENTKISVNDLIIKACGKTLQKVPQANASWAGDHVRQYSTADISVAVAIDGGLITPIVQSAEQRSVTEISSIMKDLASRAREGKLKPEEFQGGTFSLSNLGMYGISHFGAIINPPQGCILAVGAAEQKPIVSDEQIKIASMMNATLSVDHRVVDGAAGAEFLKEFKNYIENPVLLVI